MLGRRIGPKQGHFDAEPTAWVFYFGFGLGLVTGLSLSVLVLLAHALI